MRSYSPPVRYAGRLTIPKRRWPLTSQRHTDARRNQEPGAEAGLFGSRLSIARCFVRLSPRAIRFDRRSNDMHPKVDITPIGVVRSILRDRRDAPRQAFEGAPEATLEIDPALAPALDRITSGTELI